MLIKARSRSPTSCAVLMPASSGFASSRCESDEPDIGPAYNSQPLRYSRRMKRSASGQFLALRAAASHSIRCRTQ